MMSYNIRLSNNLLLECNMTCWNEPSIIVCRACSKQKELDFIALLSNIQMVLQQKSITVIETEKIKFLCMSDT